MTILDDLNDAVASAQLTKAKDIFLANPELLKQADAKGRTPVSYAASAKDTFAFSAMLETQEGKDALLKPDNDNYYPIHYAVTDTKPTRLNKILETEQGRSTVNKRNTDHFTPSMVAVFYGHDDQVTKLAKNGADPVSQKDIYLMAGYAYGKVLEDTFKVKAFEAKDPASLKPEEVQQYHHARVELKAQNTTLSNIKTYAALHDLVVPASFTDATVAFSKGADFKTAELPKIETPKPVEPKVVVAKEENIRRAIFVAPPKKTYDIHKSGIEAMASDGMPKQIHGAEGSYSLLNNKVMPTQQTSNIATTAKTSGSTVHNSPVAASSAATASHFNSKGAVGINADNEKVGEWKKSFAKRGITLSPGNKFTANDAAILVSHEIKPFKDDDNKYRFAKDAADQPIVAQQDSKTLSQPKEKRGLSALGDSLAHPLRWFNHHDNAQKTNEPQPSTAAVDIPNIKGGSVIAKR